MQLIKTLHLNFEAPLLYQIHGGSILEIINEVYPPHHEHCFPGQWR